MKKRIISLLLAAAMAVSMMACGAKNDNKAGTDAGKTEDKAQTEQTDGTETSDAEADRTQFIVGLTLNFRRMATWMRTVSTRVLIWNWRRRYVTETVGNW